MAKLVDGEQLAVQNKFKGTCSPSVDRIVTAGGKKVTFYKTTCTMEEYKKGINFEEADGMGYISEAGNFTLSKEVTEKEMYMLETAAKIPNPVLKIGDITYSEAITLDGLTEYSEVIESGEGVAIAAFSVDGKFMVYSIWGTMSNLDIGTPLNNDCAVSYTLSNSAYGTKCYCPEVPKTE